VWPSARARRRSRGLGRVGEEGKEEEDGAPTGGVEVSEEERGGKRARAGLSAGGGGGGPSVGKKRKWAAGKGTDPRGREGISFPFSFSCSFGTQISLNSNGFFEFKPSALTQIKHMHQHECTNMLNLK
jgi:hypothetical protein